MGDRQGLRPPQSQRVIERLRRPLEHDPEQLAECRRYVRRLRGRLPFHYHQGRDRLRAAPQWPSDYRAGRSGRSGPVTLVAVTKGRPATAVRAALAAGASIVNDVKSPMIWSICGCVVGLLKTQQGAASWGSRADGVNLGHRSRDAPHFFSGLFSAIYCGT